MPAQHPHRKNFKKREETAAEMATLEIKAIQASSGLRSIATALTEGQTREAEAIFQRLSGGGTTTHPVFF